MRKECLEKVTLIGHIECKRTEASVYTGTTNRNQEHKLTSIGDSYRGPETVESRDR